MSKIAAYIDTALATCPKPIAGLRHGVTPCKGRVELRLRYLVGADWLEAGRVSLSTELTLEAFDRACSRAWVFLAMEHRRLTAPPIDFVDACGNPWP